MKIRYILSSLAIIAATSSVSASDFVSTEPAERLFNFGVRLGVNASNRTFSKDYFNTYNVNSWGTGIDAGIVLNLNMRDFFSIQPGFFFESRTGNYSYVQDYINQNNENDNFSQIGHVRTYNFVVPVMLSFRFNIADNLKWLVEAGPYAQFKLHSSDSDKIEVISQSSPSMPVAIETAKSNFTDFGAKIGTGIMVNDHYSFSIHYLAGMSNVWKAPFEGGKNKAWTFTLGYDF